MNANNDSGRGVRNSFKEWAVQVDDVNILKTISTDYLRALRSEMLHTIGQIDDEMRRRAHKQA